MTPTDKPSQGTPLSRALDALYIDNHYWSKRPCETCAAITQETGIPFGCDKMAGRAAQQPTASEQHHKQRRCEICQSQGHVTLDHGDARGYSHSVVPAASETRPQWMIDAGLYQCPTCGATTTEEYKR